MAFQIVYWIFFFGALIASWHLGGHDAKAFVLMIVSATIATFFAISIYGANEALVLILIIDGLLLCCAFWWSLRTTCYWPIWFVGIHTAAVASNLTALVFPISAQGIYQNLAGFWAIPALIVMVVGTIEDRRLAIDRPS